MNGRFGDNRSAAQSKIEGRLWAENVFTLAKGGKQSGASLIPRQPSIVKAAGCICGIWPVETHATGMSVNPHSFGRANGYRLLTVSTVRLVRDQPNPLRDFFGREDEVDAAAFYCAMRHIRLNGCIELLSNRDAPNIFDAT